MDVIRALKDVDYRLTLSAADQARLDHPAGPIELTDADLDMAGAACPTGVWWCTTDFAPQQDQQVQLCTEEYCTFGWQCVCP
jgi:mersacidin/lichenicidin family type 2 lantibiotic